MTAIENLSAANSPGGSIPIATQFATESGNSGAVSTSVQGAHVCSGSFVSAETDAVICIIFDPEGNFCGFTMKDSTGDDIIRFGFCIKDEDYTNSP